MGPTEAVCFLPLAVEVSFPPLVEVVIFPPQLEGRFPPCCIPEAPDIKASVWADLRRDRPLGQPIGPSGMGCPWRRGQALSWPSSDSLQW